MKTIETDGIIEHLETYRKYRNILKTFRTSENIEYTDVDIENMQHMENNYSIRKYGKYWKYGII